MASCLMKTVSTALACAVCLETVQNPMGLDCGHIFCQNCLWNWFHRGGNGDHDDLHGAGAAAEGGRQPMDIVGGRVVANAIIEVNNLTCPSCYAGVYLAPFPIFAVRELSSVVRAHESGETMAAIEAKDAKDVLTEAIWGGLFPDDDAGRVNPAIDVEDALEGGPEAFPPNVDNPERFHRHEQEERFRELMLLHHRMHDVEPEAIPQHAAFAHLDQGGVNDLFDQHDRIIHDVFQGATAPGVYVAGNYMLRRF